MRFLLFIVILCLFPYSSDAFERGVIKVESWKAKRDKGVVKQNKDFSCGAAALATILRMYGHSVAEEEILKETAHEGRLSFEDIRVSAIKRGFKAAGFAGDINTLKRLKYPVIVFLNPEKGDEHFSIIYGIDSKRVYLADSSWGRTRMEIDRFERIWKTREKNVLYGRFLIILPKEIESYNPEKIPEPFHGNIVAVRDMIPF